jgi:hypothetical protein
LGVKKSLQFPNGSAHFCAIGTYCVQYQFVSFFQLKVETLTGIIDVSPYDYAIEITTCRVLAI